MQYVIVDLGMYLGVLIVIPIELIVFYYLLGRNHKTIEYQVTIGVLLLLNGTIIVLLWTLHTAEGSIIAFLIAVPFITITPFVVLYFLVKRIRINRLSLKRTIDVSTEATINIASIASELAASASEVNASAEEISATTEEVSSGATSQVKRLSDISQNAVSINELITLVKRSSSDIGSVMGLITEIAEQTNLLALNASIEAGRAGESGRGFAVVADEVRKLAEKSKTTVDSTSERVAEITRHVDNAVEKIVSINSAIKEVLELSEEASAAMEEINASTEEQTASMEEISSTSTRLSELSEDLKQNLTSKTQKK